MTSDMNGLSKASFDPVLIETSASKATIQEQVGSDYTIKFINGDKRELQSKTEGLAKAAKGSIALGGVAAFVATCCALTAAGAALVTPVGWAALGLLALGGACLLLRHAVQKNAEMETDLVAQLKDNLKTAVAAYLGLIIAAVVLFSIFCGGEMGAINIGLAASVAPDLAFVGDSSAPKPTFLAYKGDWVQVE